MNADLFDSLPDGALVADCDGLVLAVNAAARQMLGDEARPGARLDDALTLVDNHGVDWCSVNLPYDGLGTRNGVPEQTWLLPDGREVLVTARIVRPTPSSPVEQVALSLRSGRGRARLDRERSDLVATVAHELRSPLTGVKGFVQVLLNRWDVLNDDQKKLMLATTLADAERLSRLIAELLDVARLDTGRLGLAVRPVDPDVLVRRVVDSVSASAASREFTVSTESSAQVLADPDKFTQVVTNLVENAVRHGDGTVRVSLSDVVAADQPMVRLVVSDEGDGIDEDLRRRVITKFWTTGTASGTGLGMYLAHGLTRAHGGDFMIGERDGGGAEIVVRWPAAPATSAAGAEQ
ncbi:PAS domain-containing sensor histidine kinase [Nocardioides yefusunii]|uniref:histidine kinase n=1 Tax=Nocardioides yefusunii TaxID=2500546 RepID=A0ABW1QUD7_9ACTN|nr:PAS domain-containing sensor histidine kinase [Nocardioides yefusunii]